MSAKKSKHIVKKSTDLPSVTSKFVADNQTFCKTLKSKNKKGGPYSKTDRDVRRDEVHRLHFEFGYSAKKISELMNINRNTISGDINYWFDKIGKKMESFIDPEVIVTTHITRFELQRTRLREALDKTNVFQERLAIEKLLFDIEYKIMQTRMKLIDSQITNSLDGAERANELMKKLKRDERFVSFLDVYMVSNKAHMKIKKIINENKALVL